MVQFKQSGAYLSPSPNGYWKLDPQPGPGYTAGVLKQMLDQRGYGFRNSTSKTKLRQLLVRSSQGLLSYENLHSPELRKFVTDRKLMVPSGAKKDDLILALETADENCTFDRFFELPPELRNAIYGFHFAAFDAEIPLPVPPPIAQASQQLRNESLDLFYHSCPTRLYFSQYSTNYYSFYNSAERGPDKPLHADVTTKSIFQRMPDHLLGRIRRFWLSGLVYGPTPIYGMRRNRPVQWEVNLAAHDPQSMISCSVKPQEARVGYQKDLDTAVEKLEARIKARMVQIAAREGNMKLCRADLKDFGRMFIVADDE